jgi:hypothetical protein
MQTPFVPGLPYWRTAGDPCDCANCGSRIAPGARVLYFPNYRTVLCAREQCGVEAAKDLNAA